MTGLYELQIALETEISAIERLVGCVKHELDSLRTRDYNRLSDLISEKQMLLAEVDSLRRSRESLVSRACKQMSADDESLSILVDCLAQHEAAPLVRLRLELLRNMRELRQMNVTGRRYTRRHMRFIQEAKAVLGGDDTYAAGEYGPAGTARNSSSGGMAVNVTV